MSSTDPILEVEDLSVDFGTANGGVRAVNDVSFSVGRGEVLGFVGESGCGESTVAHALVRVLRSSAVCTGSIRFRGADVLRMTPARLRAYRWEGVSLVMRGAMNSLNPVMTVEQQIVDVIRAHRPMPRRAARAMVPALMEPVGIDSERRRAYPHELSGGMRQRCVIAMALGLEPDLVVMDEPTTTLDVVVQRGIMDEISRLCEMLGFSVLLISHDLDLVVERASRVAIMYAGSIVETGDARAVVAEPRHPCTEALLASAMPIDGPPGAYRGAPGHPAGAVRRADRMPLLHALCESPAVAGTDAPGVARGRSGTPRGMPSLRPDGATR